MSVQTDRREEFTVVLPDGWHRLDLDPSRRDASIRRLVRRAWGTGEELASVRHRLLVSYREMAESATEQGAFFCALLQDTIDGMPVSASLLAFVRASPVDGNGESFESLEAMATVLGAPSEGEERLSCEVVDLPVGGAVRSRALVPTGARASDGEEIRSDCVRYFVPLEGDRLLVLVFSTPLLPLGDALAELFAGIAHTARLGTR
jgi:hypothetical protein